MNYLVLCGFSVLAVSLTLFFKHLKNTYAICLSVLFGIILVRQALKIVASELDFFTRLTRTAAIPQTGDLILKIFGISLVVEVTADICRDAGESSLASKVELVGKAEILVLTVPTVKEILKIIENIML